MAPLTRCLCNRRDFIARGMYGLGLGAGLPFILNHTSAALAAQALEGTSIEKHPNRILVVIELSGGRVIRDERAGGYRQREETTQEFGARLWGELE